MLGSDEGPEKEGMGIVKMKTTRFHEMDTRPEIRRHRK